MREIGPTHIDPTPCHRRHTKKADVEDEDWRALESSGQRWLAYIMRKTRTGGH